MWWNISCGTCNKRCIVPFKSWAFVFWARHVWKLHEVYINSTPKEFE